jgi:NAD(P)-dependent dehydrogenase (short-subunit alcohol dehydrogenase family)
MNTACIIGASRGLGLALAEEHLKRGWRVIATVRTPQTPLHDLAARYAKTLEIEEVDINKPDQIAALRGKLEGRQIDLLFVNAGVSSGQGETVTDVSTEEFTRVMITNALSPMRAVEAFQSLVPAKGAIAVMSSGLGSVADNDRGGWEVYRASKAALNTLMRSFAARHPSDTRTMLIVAPGWIRTDMGGPQAPFSIEESVPLITDMIASNFGKPGLRYLNRLGETVRW